MNGRIIDKKKCTTHVLQIKRDAAVFNRPTILDRELISCAISAIEDKEISTNKKF